MENLLSQAITSAQQSEIAFSKFITANDTGSTGGHQFGYHIHKHSWQLFFDSPGAKGTNKDKHITIKWQNDFETISHFTYYGVRSRNEYRLTKFGRGFPFLEDENIGDLLVICKKTSDYYEAFVLQTEDEIDGFFAALNISSNETNGIIPKQSQPTSEEKLLYCFDTFLKTLKDDFPATIELAKQARSCYNSVYSVTDLMVMTNPDKEILNWLNAEFQLFKVIENDRYNERIKTHFKTVEDLVVTANTILNRRKSRAGKSLEHHLSEIFKTYHLEFITQAETEDKKRPDFLFPNVHAYRNIKFDTEKLVMLAAKTTCKDRWRQVLNEADRIKTKHLFTLQQGISRNQLEEMYKYDVCLVVPEPYLSSFPKEFKDKILTLNSFVKYIQTKQN